MSLNYLDEVKCPCGETIEAEIYQSVSVEQNPDLKEAILAGELNVVRCSACSQMVYAERFVLYHDTAQELLVFVYPSAQESDRERIQKEMADMFEQLQQSLPADNKIKYQPFLIFGMDNLCDLIRREEELYDEVAVMESLCESLDLMKRRIHPDTARRLQMPSLIPMVAAPEMQDSSGAFRTCAISGLRKALSENDHLEHYKKLLRELESNPAWTLQENV